MEQDAVKLYEQILFTAQKFLHASKTFEVTILKEQDDPSFEYLASLSERLAEIVGLVASDFDPMMHQKALDYANIMKKMSLAILNEDDGLLRDLTHELDKKPFM